jgi:hypothetical protein
MPVAHTGCQLNPIFIAGTEAIAREDSHSVTAISRTQTWQR